MREQFTDWDGDTALRAAQVLDEISDHIIPALGGAGGPTGPTRPTGPTPPTHPDTTTRTDSKDLT